MKGFWNDLGSVFGVVWWGKSGDFVKDIFKKSGFQAMSSQNTSKSLLGRFLEPYLDRLGSLGKLLKVDGELVSMFSQ